MPIHEEVHMSMEKFMEWIDTNHDGKISTHELRKALEKHRKALEAKGFRFAKFKACLAARRVDRNHNRLVDPEEIMDLVEYLREHLNIVVDIDKAWGK